MYTGKVVRFRVFALVVTLLVAATPVLGVLCQMDCDEGRTTAACHQSTSSAGGPALRGVDHPCDHDHTVSTLGVASATNARDLVEGSLLSMTTLALNYAPAPELRAAAGADMHGPPGASGRSVSSLTSVLRI